MKKVAGFQLLGPAALFTVLALSECAGRALQLWPASEWLWYLNLQWFKMFRHNEYFFKAALGGENRQLLWIALPILLGGLIGYAFRRTLLLAIASNLSFVFIAFSTFSLFRDEPYFLASLANQSFSEPRTDVVVPAALLMASLISFVISHIVYMANSLTENR